MEEIPIISSDLFHLIPVSPENVTHCNFIVTLYNNPLMLATDGKSSITTAEKAKAYIQRRFMAEYARNGYGTYLVRLKHTANASAAESELIGTVSLSRGDNEDSYKIPDLGYAIMPEHGGKGYATESSRLVMKWASEERGINDVLGLTSEGNIASRRVMEKLGMEFRGIRPHECFAPGVIGATYVLPHMNEDLSVYGFMS
jgi:RimJ/RimL family protein N-acetyltransferase